MRNFLIAILSILLSFPVPAASPNPELVKTAKRIKPGKSVTVKLVNKEKAKGTLVSATDSGVEIAGFKDNQEVRRTISYDEIKSITTKTPTWAWVTLGAVSAVAALAIVGIAMAWSN